MRTLAEIAFENQRPPAELKKAIGLLSVHASYVEEGLIESAEIWVEFHPAAQQLASQQNEETFVDVQN